MGHPGCLQRLDVRTRRRHPDHLVTDVDEGAKLWSEQPVETHVGGREVHYPHRLAVTATAFHFSRPRYRMPDNAPRTAPSSRMPPAAFAAKRDPDWQPLVPEPDPEPDAELAPEPDAGT